LLWYTQVYSANHISKPNEKLPDITKAAAIEWDKLTTTAKHIYKAESDKLFQQYKLEKEEYDKSEKVLQWLPQAIKLYQSKPIRSGYTLFYKDQYPKLRNEHPGFKVTEIAKLAGAQWKELDPKVKQDYQNQAKKSQTEWNSIKETSYSQTPSSLSSQS